MLTEHIPGAMPLTTLTRRLRAAGITLTWDITMSGKNLIVASQPIPSTLRRATQTYSRELLSLLLMADSRLCHNHKWHKRYWKHMSYKRYACECCSKKNLVNTEPLHLVGDVLIVQSKEEDEVAV